MTTPSQGESEPRQELAELRARLEEAEETLRAIRSGEVDALVMGEEVYTLKGAETPYRVLIEQMYEGAGTLLDDGTVLYANRRLAELLRIPLQELMGASLRRFVAPSELPTFDAKLAEGKQCSSSGEFTLQCQGGSELPAQLSFSVVQEEVARPICVTVTDLTERKRAEAALREQEQDFRTLAEAVPQIVWATGPDGWNIFFNKQWVDYTGLTLEESYGHGWNTPFHPDDKQRAWEAWQRATQQNESYSLECRLRRADGVYRWWLIRGAPVRSASGEIQKWFGTCTDIEDIKRAELALQQAHDTLEQRVRERTAELRQSEQLYRAIGESIDYGVWICEPDGRNTYASPSFLKMVGLTQEQCSNFGWGDVLHPDDAERTIAAWKECVRSGGNWDIEHRFRGADGQWHHILARGVPVKDERGQVLRWAGINLDITRLKQAEAELRRREEQLRASNQELTHFNNAMVGRELRMIELKKEIDELCVQFGQPPRYRSALTEQ
jgi:PAS domain S-box-containing protein